MDLHFNNAQRIGILGSTGSGKSINFYAIANELLADGITMFYYNTSKEQKYKQYIKSQYLKRFIVYMPPDIKARNLQHFELWLAHIRAEYHSYNKSKDGDVPENKRKYYTVAVDDIDLFYNSYNYTKDLSEVLKSHIGEGRKLGIGFIWLCKQVQYIPPTLFDNLDWIIIGRFNTIKGLQQLKNFAAISEILALSERRFICADLRPEGRGERAIITVEGGKICEKT